MKDEWERFFFFFLVSSKFTLHIYIKLEKTYMKWQFQVISVSVHLYREYLSSVSLQLQKFYPNTWLLWCPHKQCTVKNLSGIDKNLLLNNVWTILVKMAMNLISTFFINSYYIPFMKMKNEKRTFFCFSVFYENEKWVRAFFFLFCFLLSLHYTYT